jgi:hypothetical protein
MTEITWKKIGGLWSPQKPKDEISGKLLEVKEDVGEYSSKAYVIETEEDIRTIFGSAVLDNKMRLIKAGDFVKIVFLGNREGDKKEYKDFDVFKGAE